MRLIESLAYEHEINIATKLLSKSEDRIPTNVLKVITFCSSKNIGFILSRNVQAMTCKDARSKRNRLGHQGIPLTDELKSIIMTGRNSQNEIIVIAAHCRANMSLDLSIIQKALGLISIPDMLPEDQLESNYSMMLGTVNPFLVAANSNGTIINLFDNGLFDIVTQCPGTMMTNAGDHTWGIEFVPSQMVAAIENKICADIAVPDNDLSLYDSYGCNIPKSIGIITGNGPNSGITLWNNINKYIAIEMGDNFLGDISLPLVCTVSLPFLGLSMELDKRNTATWEAISDGIKRLQNQEVEILALACHTSHYYTDRIRDMFETDFQKKFISMPETVLRYIEQSNMNDVAMLGINYVANLGEYSAYGQLKSMDLHIESISPNTISKFHEIGYKVKQMGETYSLFQQFTSLVKNEIASQNIVIALTELSILYERHYNPARKLGKNIIDPLNEYAKEIAIECLKNEVK